MRGSPRCAQPRCTRARTRGARTQPVHARTEVARAPGAQAARTHASVLAHPQCAHSLVHTPSAHTHPLVLAHTPPVHTHKLHTPPVHTHTHPGAGTPPVHTHTHPSALTARCTLQRTHLAISWVAHSPPNTPSTHAHSCTAWSTLLVHAEHAHPPWKCSTTRSYGTSLQPPSARSPHPVAHRTPRWKAPWCCKDLTKGSPPGKGRVSG